MNRLQPNAVKNYDAYILDDPQRIDVVVQGLQQSYAELPWLEKSFARAVTRTNQIEEDDGRMKTRIWPGVYVGPGKDYEDMLEVDNYNAYSFFYQRDSEQPLEYQDRIREIVYESRLSAIFWINLNQVDPQRQDDFLPELVTDVVQRTSQARFTDTLKYSVHGVDITDIYTEPQNIFQGFTFDLAETQFLHYPYRGIRIDMNAMYSEKC